MFLEVNTLLEWHNENEGIIVERVLWIEQAFAYVININRNAQPYIRQLSMIEDAIKEGLVKKVEYDPLIVVAVEEEIPEKHKEIREKAWNAIKLMVINEPEIFDSSFRRKRIRETAQQNSISESSILGYLKRYWIRGMNMNALLPDYYACGGRGKDKMVGDKKVGRPCKNVDITGEGVNVTEEIKKIFRISINKFFYSKSKNSLVLTYELMRKEYFKTDSITETGVNIPILKPQSQIPTFRQFRYFFEKERDIKKEITNRYSNKKFQKQYRAITGCVKNDVLQPGTFEIDCQVADVYLVSRFNRNWVIGRPALYCCIDKFSSLICGVYVGLESGSFLGAAMAILNTCIDKVGFCKSYGIDIIKEQWPIQALPQTIIADRGELEGAGIENLINTLGVKVQNAPPYRADWKASIERFFGLANERTKPFMPGVVDLDGRERGDADYRLKSRLDLYQFTQVIIKCILFHNNHYHMENYKREEMMIQDDILCTPINIFNWGIANRGGTLRSVSEDIVKLALMPKDTATVTSKGIRFKDMFYVSKAMLTDQTFIKARTKGTWRVNIVYDPRNLKYIYVYDTNINDFEKCFLVDENSRYIDKSFEEIQYLLEIEKMQKADNRDAVAQAKVELIGGIEDIIKQAEEDYKKEPEILESNRQRVKNIRMNRQLEKAANRKKEAFELSPKMQVEQKQNSIELHDNDSTTGESGIDLLFKKQKEGLGKIHGND